MSRPRAPSDRLDRAFYGLMLGETVHYFKKGSVANIHNVQSRTYLPAQFAINRLQAGMFFSDIHLNDDA